MLFGQTVSCRIFAHCVVSDNELMDVLYLFHELMDVLYLFPKILHSCGVAAADRLFSGAVNRHYYLAQPLRMRLRPATNLAAIRNMKTMIDSGFYLRRSIKH